MALVDPKHTEEQLCAVAQATMALSISCKILWFKPSYTPIVKKKNSSWHKMFSAANKICEAFSLQLNTVMF